MSKYVLSNDAARQSATGLNLLFRVFCGLFACLFVCFFLCSRAHGVRHCALHVQLRSARGLTSYFVCFCVIIVLMTEVCVIAEPFL